MEAGIYERLRLAYHRESNIYFGKPTKVVARSRSVYNVAVLLHSLRSSTQNFDSRVARSLLAQDDS